MSLYDIIDVLYRIDLDRPYIEWWDSDYRTEYDSNTELDNYRGVKHHIMVF